MSYELDQGGATRLIVEQDKTMDGVTPLVLIQAEHLMGDRVTVMVKPSQAPALALAILEAAGVTPSLTASLDCPEHYERRRWPTWKRRGSSGCARRSWKPKT